MSFKEDIAALEEAEKSGDQLAGFKAQLQFTLGRMRSLGPDGDDKTMAMYNASLTSLRKEIVRLEGLKTTVNPEDESRIAEEDILRNTLGIGL